ncbi:MAG: glutamate--tRNA ligase [bacterium]|nr:glutamate--tRNA ligase [bacterium]
MDQIRTRIAPSPTGSLHIGTARTALFNYLFAKKHGGAFVLRIEDTDLERSDAKYEKEILDSLKWLGIVYNEGPDAGGSYGPYRQSERLAMYKKYLVKMLHGGSAFYCFHTGVELEAEKTEQVEKKWPIHHVCKDWRNLSLEEAEKKREAGEASIIRFKMPAESLTTPPNYQIVFDDMIRGQVHFSARLLGDFSLAKSLEAPLYNFAVVVDDHEMQITHVIRGEDHISNTPKQILIARALGWAPEVGVLSQTPWRYAHLPLILGTDRSKLSKRHGATAIVEFKEQGYLPEALINFMALLGWNPGSEREIFSLSGLVDAFDISHVQKAGAVFNIEKLDWLNGEYIRKKSSRELTELCKPYLEDFLKFQIPNSKFQIEYIEKVITLEQPRLKKLSEIGERVGYFFHLPEYDAELLMWKNMSADDLCKSLDKAVEILLKIESAQPTAEELNSVFMPVAEEMGDRGMLLWPLRAALSGKKASPGPFEIIAVLGKDESFLRLKKAREKLA